MGRLFLRKVNFQYKIGENKLGLIGMGHKLIITQAENLDFTLDEIFH